MAESGSGSGSGYVKAALAALQFSGAQSEADAIRRESEFRKMQLEFNAKLAGIRAEDAIFRGQEQVADYTKQSEYLKGAQLASLAAQGIEVDSGTAAQIQYETDKQIQTDVKRIKNNAWREAWGYKIEAVNLRTESRLESLSAKNRSDAAILSGGIDAVKTVLG